MDDLQLFAPFTKVSQQADGSILVHSVINDETVDDQGEVMDYAGTKAALDDFMTWRNVREMHQPSAVGTAESITHNDLAKRSEGILRIVDPSAVAKVLAKVYKGTSVGGNKGGQFAMEKLAGRPVRRILAPVINEISLVDRPSRPTAALTLMKRATMTTPAIIEGLDQLLAGLRGYRDTHLAKGAIAPASDAISAIDQVEALRQRVVAGGIFRGELGTGSEILAKMASTDLEAAGRQAAEATLRQMFPRGTSRR